MAAAQTATRRRARSMETGDQQLHREHSPAEKSQEQENEVAGADENNNNNSGVEGEANGVHGDVKSEGNTENDNDHDHEEEDRDEVQRLAAIEVAELLEQQFTSLKDTFYEEQKRILAQEEQDIVSGVHEEVVEQFDELERKMEVHRRFLRAKRDEQIELARNDWEFKLLHTHNEVMLNHGEKRMRSVSEARSAKRRLVSERERLADRLVVVEEKILLERHILQKQYAAQYKADLAEYHRALDFYEQERARLEEEHIRAGYDIYQHPPPLPMPVYPPQKPPVEIPAESVLESGFYDEDDALADALGYTVVPNEYGSGPEDVRLVARAVGQRPAPTIVKSVSVEDAEAYRPAMYLPFWSWPRNKSKLQDIAESGCLPVASASLKTTCIPQEIMFDLEVITGKSSTSTSMSTSTDSIDEEKRTKDEIINMRSNGSNQSRLEGALRNLEESESKKEKQKEKDHNQENDDPEGLIREATDAEEKTSCVNGAMVDGMGLFSDTSMAILGPHRIPLREAFGSLDGLKASPVG